jgi:hypothetical protein
MKLVIAPDKKQFDRFVYEERCRLAGTTEPIEFRYCTGPEKLQGYRGELIVVNADQLPGDSLLLYAEVHDDKHCPVRWVDLALLARRVPTSPVLGRSAYLAACARSRD